MMGKLDFRPVKTIHIHGNRNAVIIIFYDSRLTGAIEKVVMGILSTIRYAGNKAMGLFFL